MNSTAAANVAATKRVTLHDVAAAAGVGYSTAHACLSGRRAGYAQSTVNKVLITAQNLGYTKDVAANNRRYGRALFGKTVKPANPLFASRAAETAAMTKLRMGGHSNPEIAHRCGVAVTTVRRRIGDQPDEITAANMKLAGKVRTAKTQIKRNYERQQLITAYNAKVEALNAEMEKVNKMAAEIESIRKSAANASKATGTPLLRLLKPTKIN